ncbi:unnamed protein product [Sphagnum tenellum]
MDLDNWQNVFFLRNADGSLDNYRLDATFPNLTAQQLNSIRPFGEELDLPAGHILYQRGDLNVDFYVILQGAVEVYESDSCGKDRVLVIHKANNFPGEVTQFSGRKSLINARTFTPTRILRVRNKDFKRMLVAEPELGELILRAYVLRRSGIIRHETGGVTLIGTAQDPETIRIRQFLIRNAYPHRLIPPDAKAESGRSLLASLSLRLQDLPAVVISKQNIIKKPSLNQLASEIGLLETFPLDHTYDVAIVGGGPAGLAASVYAASEGLDTVLLEAIAPGGQAGTSSRIENYLGFPNGISGLELASRAEVQALKFGVHIGIARAVIDVKKVQDGTFEILLCDQTKVRTRSVVVASGARYRKLNLPNYQQFEGQGIYYWAMAMEAQFCVGEEVVVVGGGNSAGQAAIYLSQSASKVHMLVRGKSLSETMSTYLVERILASLKIQIYYETELTHLSGRVSDKQSEQRILEEVEWKSSANLRHWVKSIRNVFVMIGALPNTDWLRQCIALDPQGFVITGKTKAGLLLSSPYETAQPGIFAVGDVRSESVKRMASAVGEGAIVIQWVHQYLTG